MKYIKYEDTLICISDKDWKKYCRQKADGLEPSLPGKMLEYVILDITTWEREDYARAIGLEEVPSDLPIGDNTAVDTVRFSRKSNTKSDRKR